MSNSRRCVRGNLLRMVTGELVIFLGSWRTGCTVLGRNGVQRIDVFELMGCERVSKGG